MKMRNVIFPLAILSMLTTCDSGNQQSQGSGSSSVDSVSVGSEVASATSMCEHHLGFTMYVAGKDPIFCYHDSLTDSYAKNFTHILVDGKFHECSFKEFQAGEDNSGMVIWNEEAHDELTGYVYQMAENISTDYKDFMAILFEKEFVVNHHIATIENNSDKALSETAKAYFSKRFPTLTIDKVITSASVDKGFANFYTIQFKKVADSCLAINAIEKDGKLYVNENWAHGDWNVDDGGEYPAPDVRFFIANDNSHFDVFFEQYATESTTLGEFVVDGENLQEKIINSYYNYVDYTSKRKPNTYILDIQWKKLFTCYDGSTPFEIDSPAFYYVEDFNGDGAKEVLAKLDNNYAFFTFDNGNLRGVGSTFDRVSGSEFGTLDLYRNGVVTSGGTVVRSETSIYLFGNTRESRISYSEVLCGSDVSYEKSNPEYDKEKSNASSKLEYDGARTKLGAEINLKNLKWVQIERQ